MRKMAIQRQPAPISDLMTSISDLLGKAAFITGLSFCTSLIRVSFNIEKNLTLAFIKLKIYINYVMFL